MVVTVSIEERGRMMDQPTMETLARRLDKVERENRRLKQAGTAVLAVMAAVVLMGQGTLTARKTIRAQNFVIVDSNGIPRGGMGISVDEKIVALILRDQQSKNRVTLIVNTDNTPSLVLLDENEKSRFVATVRKDRVALDVTDRNEKVIWSAP